MRKIAGLILAAAMTLMIVGCSGGFSQQPLALATFSYEEELARYQQEDILTDPNQFVNQTESKIKDQLDAEDLAKKECTIEYNTISDYYDKNSDMWGIEFWTQEKQENGIIIEKKGTQKQKIFLNGQGITKSIIYETVE